MQKLSETASTIIIWTGFEQLPDHFRPFANIFSLAALQQLAASAIARKNTV